MLVERIRNLAPSRLASPAPRARRSFRIDPSVESLESLVLRSGVPSDFDGDGKADAMVFDKTSSAYIITLSANNSAPQVVQIGNPAHDIIPVSGDFDGDSRADFAVYDKTVATFFVKTAANPNVTSITSQIGDPTHTAGIDPVPKDFTGDGKTDFAIFDRVVSAFFVKDASNPGPTIFASQIGNPQHAASIVPGPADFDGDGKADFAIYDKTVATFFVKYATNPNAAVAAESQVGDPNHAGSIVPVQADYDGDGKVDFAIYDRAVATYYVKYAVAPTQLGVASQIGDPGHASSITPEIGDFDGDKKSDFAIFDRVVSTYFVKTATNPNAAIAGGSQIGDVNHINGIAVVPGDYDGDGKLDYGIYDKNVGSFFVKLATNPNAAVAGQANLGVLSHLNITYPEAIV